MTSVAWDEKAAVLAHYQLQAALAAFERQAEPDPTADDEALSALQTAVELAQCNLKSALSAIERRDIEAANRYVSDALFEFGVKQ